MKDEKSLRVLDARCGTGLLVPVLKRMAKNDRVTLEIIGVDFSKEMLQQAEEKNVYESPLEADLNDPPPYSEGSFDCFLAGALFVAGHCGPSGLPSIVKVVKTGGFGFFIIRRKTYLDESQNYSDVLKKLNCKVVKDTVGHYMGPVEVNYVVVQKMGDKF